MSLRRAITAVPKEITPHRSDGYDTPDGDYGAPVDDYQSPVDEYVTPDDHFMTPDGGYESPEGNYTTPDTGFQSPDDGYFISPIDDNESDSIDLNQSIESAEPDLALVSVSGVKFRYNVIEFSNGQEIDFGWSEGRFTEQEFVEWDEEEAIFSHTPYVYLKTNRNTAYFILNEEDGGEITVNLVFDSNRSGNGTWTETDAEGFYYGTLDFEIEPMVTDEELSDTPVDHNETLQPDTGPIDHNQSVSDQPSDSPETGEGYVPIIRTLESALDENGTLVVGGRVLTDGGSDMLEVGILLVESSSGQEFRKMGSLDSASGEFFIEFPELAPGSYSYGAYGINEIGETQGSVRYIEIPGEDNGSFILDGVEMGDGWMNSSWLGIFRKYDNGWIFHARLGWLYLSDDGQDGLWFWMESQGWVWTQAEVYPFLWKQQSLDWLYLFHP